MIHFSFIPLKKLSAELLNSLETRYELEEVVSLGSFEQLKLYVSLFGGKLTQSALGSLEEVDQSWILTGKLKVLNEAELDGFYKQWLSKSGRKNNMDEFCQLASFSNFVTQLNKAKHKVILQNTI